MYAVHSGDGYLFSLGEKAIYQYELREGSSLSDGELSFIKSKSDLQKAKERGMRLIARRAHSTGELREKLRQHHDTYTTEAVIQSLLELDLLDDAAFAQMRAEHLAESGKSLRDIRERLRGAGVDRRDIDDALNQLSVEEADVAERVLRKSYLVKLDAGEREKVFAAMARRGFEHESILKALRSIEDRQHTGR